MPIKRELTEDRILIKDGLKRCHKCKEIKPISEYYKRANRPCGTSGSCNKCAYKSIRHSHLKKCYNITKKDWNNMFDLQKGKCLICGKHQKELHLTLAVDHDHITGKVRGLLCFKCNVGLGALNDDITLLENAIKYLTIHKEDGINS